MTPRTVVADLTVAVAAGVLLTRYCRMVRGGSTPGDLSRALSGVRAMPLVKDVTSIRVMAIVRRVAQVHPLRPACLEQSLAACHVLNAAGRAAIVQLGVAPPGHGGTLQAHAWVEAPDLPVPHNGGADFVTLGILRHLS